MHRHGITVSDGLCTWSRHLQVSRSYRFDDCQSQRSRGWRAPFGCEASSAFLPVPKLRTALKRHSQPLLKSALRFALAWTDCEKCGSRHGTFAAGRLIARSRYSRSDCPASPLRGRSAPFGSQKVSVPSACSGWRAGLSLRPRVGDASERQYIAADDPVRASAGFRCPHDRRHRRFGRGGAGSGMERSYAIWSAIAFWICCRNAMQTAWPTG